MLRKTMIALFAAASVGMLAPSVASARGGFGGGGGGFHGGGGGGFHGGGFWRRLPRRRFWRRRFPLSRYRRRRFPFSRYRRRRFPLSRYRRRRFPLSRYRRRWFPFSRHRRRWFPRPRFPPWVPPRAPICVRCICSRTRLPVRLLWRLRLSLLRLRLRQFLLWRWRLLRGAAARAYPVWLAYPTCPGVRLIPRSSTGGRR